MNNLNLEFLSYEEVFGEKHLGIATIRFDRRIIFRTKISPKDGGYWTQSAAYKITRNAKEQYVSAFQFDSQYEAEQVKEFIIEHVAKYYEIKQAPKNLSALQPIKQAHIEVQNEFPF